MHSPASVASPILNFISSARESGTTGPGVPFRRLSRSGCCHDNGIMDNYSSRASYFARTNHRNARIPFGIKQADRLSHIYLIGKTGVGKSTLLENLALQD